MDLSIIVPCLNEAENLSLLVKRINNTFDKNKIRGEIILINDGSNDNSHKVMEILKKQQPHIFTISHDKIRGIAECWKTGLKLCHGKYVLTTDADMQYLPEDIPLLYFEILNGYDIVQGWRKEVKDGLLLRRIQSVVLSGVLNFIFSLNLKDVKSGFIAYKKDVFTDILSYDKDYAYFHQLITVAARAKDYSIKQLPVVFVKRNAGRSFLGNLPIKFIFNTFKDIVKAYQEYREL